MKHTKDFEMKQSEDLKMGKSKKKYLIFALIVAIIIVIILGCASISLAKKTAIQGKEMKDLRDKIEEMENRQIEVDSIREEVKQISKYSAYEFQYTSVICFSDSNKFMGFNIPLTGNNFIATIDEQMNIGIDGDNISFSEIKNSEGRVTQVELSVPHSQILDNYTIQDSLEIYDEKNNIFNPVKVNDYTQLIVEAESQEEEKVLNSDILQKSDETIKYLLTSHFQAVYGDSVKIQYEYLE